MSERFHAKPFTIAWAVFRDDEFYGAERTREIARELARMYSPGSKHKWSVGKVGIVNPVGNARD